MRRPDSDTHARSPDDGRADRNAAIPDEQPAAAEVRSVVSHRDAHGHREIARTAAELVRVKRRRGAPTPPFHRARPAAPHRADALERLERPDQHGRGRSLRFGDDVDEGMDPVVEIDVGVSGLTVKGRVTFRRPRRSMTRRIGFPDVRFDLDDHAARAYASPRVDKNLADEIAGDIERRPIVEAAGEFSHECPASD